MIAKNAQVVYSIEIIGKHISNAGALTRELDWGIVETNGERWRQLFPCLKGRNPLRVL
jgi:hypothetical protein